MKINAVIMAGGLGSRLWPLSTSSNPKQFISLNGNYSSFQQTILRSKAFHNITVITNNEYVDVVQKQSKKVGVEVNIIVEPESKGTAPCALVASCICDHPDDIVILLPSDHKIDLLDKYITQLQDACSIVESNPSKIAMLGIKPTSPYTGFGYIKAGKWLVDDIAYKVEAFKEKPTLELAQEYYISKEYYWNSGIFIFKPHTLLSIAEGIDPDAVSLACMSVINSKIENGVLYIDKAEYKQFKENSIDKAFIEKAVENIILLEAQFSWRDMGSWEAMWGISDKDNNKNSLAGNVITNQVKNSYVLSDEKLTAVIGLEDVIVVNTKNATLVANRSHSEDVKMMVNEMNDNNHSSSIKEIHGMRGSYKMISHSSDYNVFDLTIKPGQRFTINQIDNLSGNIVMVCGSAEIIIGDQTNLLKQNDALNITADKEYIIYNNTKSNISLLAIKPAS